MYCDVCAAVTHMQCPHCKVAYFCCRACFKKAWREHKKVCPSLKSAEVLPHDAETQKALDIIAAQKRKKNICLVAIPAFLGCNELDYFRDKCLRKIEDREKEEGLKYQIVFVVKEEKGYYNSLAVRRAVEKVGRRIGHYLSIITLDLHEQHFKSMVEVEIPQRFLDIATEGDLYDMIRTCIENDQDAVSTAFGNVGISVGTVKGMHEVMAGKRVAAKHEAHQYAAACRVEELDT